jgi:hypothetical protein
MSKLISSEETIWSVLTGPLARQLLLDISAMNITEPTPAFLQLVTILLQQPDMDLVNIAPLYNNKSDTWQNLQSSQTQAESPSSDKGASKHSSVQANTSAGKSTPASTVTANKRPRDAPGDVCTRNGAKVGLRGSGGLSSGESAVEDSAKRRKTNKDKEKVNQDPSSDPDRPSPEKGQKPARARPTPTNVIPKTAKSVNAPVWCTNGKPPPLDVKTDTFFSLLCSMHSNNAMATLSSLVNSIISNNISESTSTSYDLSFSSLLARCKQLTSMKALRDFHAAILYIRLAFHIDL